MGPKNWWFVNASPFPSGHFQVPYWFSGTLQGTGPYPTKLEKGIRFSKQFLACSFNPDYQRLGL